MTRRKPFAAVGRLAPQARIYIALAIFNLLSAGASVLVSQQLLGRFTDSVAINRAWAARVDRVARLGKLTGDANAPGNDVFESKDVPGERAKKAAAAAAFRAQSVATRAEVSAALAPDVGTPILEKLGEADRGFSRMEAEADAIFEAFARGDADAAGARMASMDQAFAEVRAALDDVRSLSAVAQGADFASQTATAQRLRAIQSGVALLVILVIAGVTAYGLRLAAQFVAAQADLVRQRGDMKLVFDNVAQGLVTVGRDGVVSAERSRVVDKWFGAPDPQVDFARYLARGSAADELRFQLGFDQFTEDVMPRELSLDQLPKRIVVSGTPLGLEYRPVYDDSDKLAKLVIVISDRTADEAREAASADQQELVAIFERVGRDREGYLGFFADSVEKITQLVAGTLDRAQTLHVLHTLKGNGGVFGAVGIAAHCHILETELSERNGGLDDVQRGALRDRWDAFAARVTKMLGAGGHGRISVKDEDYADVLRAILEQAPHDEILARVLRWKREDAEPRLEVLADHARQLAERLGKSPLDVQVEATDVRLPVGSWHAFFAALTHAVRNAVDHGIEMPEQRQAEGKGVARLALRALDVDGTLVVEVEDTGRGIDWAKLVARGEQLGLPTGSPQDRVALLFTDGLSTRAEVDDLSGRGIGLGAIKAECERRGGRIDLVSRPGTGTVLRCVFSKEASNPVGRPSFVKGLLRIAS